MFRARFSEAFPPKLANLGPQDIERGIVDGLPSPQVEGLLCALLGLVLNRKKPVELVLMRTTSIEFLLTRQTWPLRTGLGRRPVLPEASMAAGMEQCQPHLKQQELQQHDPNTKGI
jgi:hypothetical protein